MSQASILMGTKHFERTVQTLFAAQQNVDWSVVVMPVNIKTITTWQSFCLISLRIYNYVNCLQFSRVSPHNAEITRGHGSFETSIQKNKPSGNYLGDLILPRDNEGGNTLLEALILRALQSVIFHRRNWSKGAILHETRCFPPPPKHSQVQTPDRGPAPEQQTDSQSKARTEKWSLFGINSPPWLGPFSGMQAWNMSRVTSRYLSHGDA